MIMADLKKITKIAILGSGNGSNFEAIVEFFKGSEVEILCISDVEDSMILKRAKNLGVENMYLPFEKNAEFFRENKFNLGVLAGYMRVLDKETLKNQNFINIHPSLLPAFKGKNAIERAFSYGVKVSGVTVHHVDENLDEGQIIAQYPVIIDETMNLSEFEVEIHKVEHSLYPAVIKSILSDKLFSFDMFFKSFMKSTGQNSGGCGGCGGGKGCSH